MKVYIIIIIISCCVNVSSFLVNVSSFHSVIRKYSIIVVIYYCRETDRQKDRQRRCVALTFGHWTRDGYLLVPIPFWALPSSPFSYNFKVVSSVSVSRAGVSPTAAVKLHTM